MRHSAMIDAAVAEKRRATSIGLVGNAAEIYPEIFRRGVIPDIVTDQTSAHDLIYGYGTEGLFSLEEVRALLHIRSAKTDGGLDRLDRRPRPRHARFPAGRR